MQVEAGLKHIAADARESPLLDVSIADWCCWASEIGEPGRMALISHRISTSRDGLVMHDMGGGHAVII